MNKEVLNSILPTMDTNNIVKLVHNHLCGLRVIENKDREDVKVEHGLNEDNTELDYNLSVFMRYVIKKKEVIFTPT